MRFIYTYSLAYSFSVHSWRIFGFLIEQLCFPFSSFHISNTYSSIPGPQKYIYALWMWRKNFLKNSNTFMDYIWFVLFLFVVFRYAKHQLETNQAIHGNSFRSSRPNDGNHSEPICVCLSYFFDFIYRDIEILSGLH